MISISASKISTYLQCPRKFRFRYIDRIPPQWKASALALGSAVHGALETFHEQRTQGASMRPDALSELFRIDLAAELCEEIHFKAEEPAESLEHVGAQLVAIYAAANQRLAVRAAEVSFELPVTHDIVLRGVFDAILQGDRVREIKTAARDYDEGTLSRHIQVSAYAWAYPALFGHDAVVEVVALLKQKHPRMVVHEVRRTAEEQEWFVGLVIDVVQSIKAGSFPPNPSWACTGCEYTAACKGITRRDQREQEPIR